MIRSWKSFRKGISAIHFKSESSAILCIALFATSHNIYYVKLAKIGFPGRGMGRKNGQGFSKGTALPGQSAEIRIERFLNADRRGFAVTGENTEIFRKNQKFLSD